MALNCPNSPGISIDNPGLFQFSGKKQPVTGKVFVNVFNTQWGTNFTEWIEGSFSSKMYIWSFPEYDSEKSLITPSEETRMPLKGVFYEGPKGRNPLVREGVSLSRKGILVTAYRKINAGTELRLWEQAGKSGMCEVTLDEDIRFRRAYPSNLRGEIIDEKGIEIFGRSFQCMIKANQPVSFILK
jgi:hypothetical protein